MMTRSTENKMNARNLLVALLFWVFFILPIPVLAAPASGYWWNPNAPGSGFVIEVQGNEMFLASFLYAADGQATWVASNGLLTSPTTYSGALITYTGGQTLTGPYGSAPTPTAPLGNITVAFQSA